jgi:DNA adenine methylase
MSTKPRIVLPWYGGKSQYAAKINDCFLPHGRYVEPFAGSLANLIAKKPAYSEVANDLNAGLMNLYRVLTGRTAEFLALLAECPFAEATFVRAKTWLASDCEIERAAGFLIRNRMSFASSGRSFQIDRMGAGGSGWAPYLAGLPATAARLSRVRLCCEPALDVIRRHDGPGTLFYVDPPYLEETRSNDRHYAVEMSAADHEALLGVLNECAGMVYLSGYRSPLYDRLLADWQRVEWTTRSRMSGSDGAGRDRTECLWARGNAGLYMATHW